VFDQFFTIAYKKISQNSGDKSPLKLSGIPFFNILDKKVIINGKRRYNSAKESPFLNFPILF
jgi:hypothetical protein